MIWKVSWSFPEDTFSCEKLTFTCPKLTIKTLERWVKYIQSYQKKHQNDVIDVVLVFLLLTLNMFNNFF